MLVMQPVDGSYRRPCAYCYGSGELLDCDEPNDPDQCPDCGGTGWGPPEGEPDQRIPYRLADRHG